MAPKLSREARMTIIELLRRGWSRMAIAESLGVTEGSVRYHERRRREGRSDGRVGRQQHRLAALAREVEAWLSAEAGRREHLNLALLHDYLIAEHGYDGSLRSVQRYFRAHYAPPRLRARRRVETPPGAARRSVRLLYHEFDASKRDLDLCSFPVDPALWRSHSPGEKTSRVSGSRRKAGASRTTMPSRRVSGSSAVTGRT